MALKRIDLLSHRKEITVNVRKQMLVYKSCLDLYKATFSFKLEAEGTEKFRV